MDDKLNSLLERATADIHSAGELSDLADIRLKYLGKKQGELTVLLKQVSQLDPQQRPQVGKSVNVVKGQLAQLLAQQEQHLQAEALAQQLKQQSLDMTLPGRGERMGGLHPVTRITDLATSILIRMGFTVEQINRAFDEAAPHADYAKAEAVLFGD